MPMKRKPRNQCRNMPVSDSTSSREQCSCAHRIAYALLGEAHKRNRALSRAPAAASRNAALLGIGDDENS